MEDFKGFVGMVETTIDMERVQSAHEYCIKPNFDEKLKSTLLSKVDFHEILLGFNYDSLYILH